MPRIRYIKPEFFEDETIAELDYKTKLCYIGLWTHFLDRTGVMEYGKRGASLIKSKLFPYDDKVQVEHCSSMVQQLCKTRSSTSGLPRLVPFEYEGKLYLYCHTFEKHQLFHKSEKPKYAIPKDFLKSTVLPPLKNGSKPVQELVGTDNGELAMSNGEQEGVPPRGKTPRTPKKSKPEKKTCTWLWKIVVQCHKKTYEVEPERNKTVNSLLCQIIEKVGEGWAGPVVHWYYKCPNTFYRSKGHDLSYCSKDYQKLLTEVKKKGVILKDPKTTEINKQIELQETFKEIEYLARKEEENDPD